MDPFTISAGIGAVGSLFKGLTSLFGSNNQAKAYENAARQAGAEAGLAAQTQLQQGDAVAAHAATQAAANGGGLVGSSLSVIQDLSQKAMFNARAAAYRGVTEVQRDLYQAKVARAQGMQDLIGSGISAAGQLYGGFAQSSFAKQQIAAMKQLRGDYSPGLDGVP